MSVYAKDIATSEWATQEGHIVPAPQEKSVPAMTWQTIPMEKVMELGRMACALLERSPNDAMKMAGTIMAGLEMGIPPMTAARSIFIIKGRPTLSSEMQRALVLASPKCESFVVHEAVKENNDISVTVEGKRSSGETRKVTARLSQFRLVKNNEVWVNYPERMLIAAASRWLIRDLFPDIISGWNDMEEWQGGLVPETEDGAVPQIAVNLPTGPGGPVGHGSQAEPPKPPSLPQPPSPPPMEQQRTVEAVKRKVKRPKDYTAKPPPPVGPHQEAPKPVEAPTPETAPVEGQPDQAAPGSPPAEGDAAWSTIMGGG